MRLPLNVTNLEDWWCYFKEDSFLIKLSSLNLMNNQSHDTHLVNYEKDTSIFVSWDFLKPSNVYYATQPTNYSTVLTTDEKYFSDTIN